MNVKVSLSDMQRRVIKTAVAFFQGDNDYSVQINFLESDEVTNGTLEGVIGTIEQAERQALLPGADLHFDNTQAHVEGWTISERDEKDATHPFELQKLDEADNFVRDEDAWAWVFKQAESGSTYHQTALSFLKDRAPREYRSITAHGRRLG